MTMAGKKVYEGSKADIAEDKKGAKAKGMSLKAYEKTARDKAEDKRGQARIERKK
jgi:hypothetical protein